MEINGNKKMPVESVDKMSTKNHKVSSIVETLDFKQFLSHRSSRYDDAYKNLITLSEIILIGYNSNDKGSAIKQKMKLPYLSS